MTKLRRAYLRYNAKYFNNQLPKDATIVWHDLPDCFGECYQKEKRILIDRATRRVESTWRMTLLHEMVHLAVPHTKRHGKDFQREMRRLAMAGAFNRLW